MERLKQYLHEKNQKGLAEAEKALKKYPHDFNVVHESAELYCVFGVELQNQSLLLRALELLEQSRLLLPQNTDPQISVLTIYGEMADVYLMLDEGEKAVNLLKAHNAGGLYSDVIGLILATNRKRPDEAVPFLSESLLKNTTAIIRTIMGYINVFFQQEDYNSAQAILLWGDHVLSGLRNENKNSFLDKINSVFHVCLAESNRALEGDKFSKRRIKILVGMIGAVTGIFAQLGVFLIGAYLALSGYGLTPGVVIIFVNLMNFMIQPIAELPGLLASRKAALGLIGKLATALEKNPASGGSAALSRLEKGIRLEQVSFSYDGEKDVLHEISAEFKAGKAYAIVGGSGSGKSTLLHLLMAGSREYAGSILLDGTELRSIAPESLYETISAVQQNVFVFNASIKDNVSMFRSFPQQELDEAIRHAHLTGLIAERGEGYLCGEGGSGLSGGEKQRISIARSLLKKSSVLLADEVTASLDAQTAHQVTNDILDLHGMTRIIVTHTLEESLLRRYDGILVLKDGRIDETGSFDELMEKKGYFFALFTVAQ